jgi:hypothetical protein
VLALHHADLLDVSVIHGDGTTTAAKKGGDNLGFNGHKKVKGDKTPPERFTTRRPKLRPRLRSPANPYQRTTMNTAPTILKSVEVLEESRRLIQQSRTLLDLGRVQITQSRTVIEDTKKLIATVSDHIAGRRGW